MKNEELLRRDQWWNSRMPVKAMTMPQPVAVLNNVIIPHGAAGFRHVAYAGTVRRESMLSPKGKNASLPRATPVMPAR